MESSIEDLLAALTEGRVLTPDVFGDIDADEVLASREDDESFDEAWNRCFSQIEKRYSEREIPPDTEETVEEIREQSLDLALHGTDHHELANVIAEDFDLFARATVLEYANPFLESLWEVYESGEIPCPASMAES